MPSHEEIAEREARKADRPAKDEQRNQDRESARAELLAEQEAERVEKEQAIKVQQEVASKMKKQAIYDALDNLDEVILAARGKDQLNWYQHEAVRVALRHYGAQL